MLLVAIGSAGGPRFLYVSPILRITAACYALTDATAAAIAAHAAAAACAARRVFRNSLLGGDSCAKTHGSSKPLNGSQAAQRLSHSARRSVEDGPTAIRVCALATGAYR